MSSQRIERCYTDNIYLIESLPPEEDYERKYLIMGNSGHTYKVTITNKPYCTCPDYRNRRNRCKHIYFVLIRIMNIENYTDREFSDEELSEMFENIPHIARHLMYQGDNTAEQKEVSQKFDKGDVCPVCLNPLENGKELDYCKYSCGKTIHKKCFNMWEKSKGGICVFCRGRWYSSNSDLNPKKVSMHPIENIEIIQEDNDNNSHTNNDYEKIEIDDDEIKDNDNDSSNNDDEDDYYNRHKKNKNKNKKRNKSRSRSRNKSKSLSRNENRSQSKSRSRNKNKKKKRIRYPKK
jgi:hypothetical protein